MRTSLQNVRDIFVNPRQAFVHLKDDPKWLLAFALHCLSFVVVAWVTDPFEAHLSSANISEEGGASDSVRDTYPIIYLVTAVLGGSFIMLMFALLSGFLWTVARLFRINRSILKFSHIYVCLLHITLITVCEELLNTVLLLIFRTPQDVYTRIDLQLIPGLHDLLGFVQNEKLLMFLSSYNLFSVWEIVLTVIAVVVLIGVDRLRAILIALCLSLVMAVPFLIYALYLL